MLSVRSIEKLRGAVFPLRVSEMDEFVSRSTLASWVSTGEFILKEGLYSPSNEVAAALGVVGKPAIVPIDNQQELLCRRALGMIPVGLKGNSEQVIMLVGMSWEELCSEVVDMPKLGIEFWEEIDALREIYAAPGWGRRIALFAERILNG